MNNRNIYIAGMKFHKTASDGTFENEHYSIICYSMEEAISEILTSTRDELWYYTGFQESPAMKDMIREMNHGKCTCSFYIDEYSGNRKRFKSQMELYSAFEKIIEEGGMDLYEELLSIVDHQRYYLNSFCEVTRVETIPVKINGHVAGTGSFTREDCKNGYYGGTFRYLPGNEVDDHFKEYDGNIYQACCKVIRKKANTNDRTKWEPYFECFYSLKEAEDAATSHYYKVLAEYMPDVKCPSKELLLEKAKDNILGYEISVRVISNQKVQFASLKEFTAYYAKNVLNVKKEDMYKFLLSLVRYDERVYDHTGEYLRSKNHHQIMEDRSYYRLLPLFSMETAKDINFQVK